MNLYPPHTRGDVTLSSAILTGAPGSAPHAWGCNTSTLWITMSTSYPPHTRGDVTVIPGGAGTDSVSAPHAWGCNLLLKQERDRGEIRPTRVGM